MTDKGAAFMTDKGASGGSRGGHTSRFFFRFFCFSKSSAGKW